MLVLVLVCVIARECGRFGQRGNNLSTRMPSPPVVNSGWCVKRSTLKPLHRTVNWLVLGTDEKMYHVHTFMHANGKY